MNSSALNFPGFSNLFSKFRIGKIHFTFVDPSSGEEVSFPVLRCGDCHAAEPVLADTSRGLEVSAAIVERTHELTAMTARAERILLRARRGGVETRAALEELEQAVNAQIQLEVLVHTFDVNDGGPFQEKHQEGLEHARLALEAGKGALEELAYRRRGLVVSLVIIVLVLIALAMKIRDVSSPTS